MAKNDWYEAGEEIKNLVQDAIENQDFAQLSTTISNVVNRAADGFQEALRDSLRGRPQSTSKENRDWINGEWREIDPDGETYGKAETEADGRASKKKIEPESETYRNTAENTDRKKQKRQQTIYTNHEAADRIKRELKESKKSLKPVRKKLKAPGQASGAVMKYTGYSLGSMFGLSLAILGVVSYTTGVAMEIAFGTLGVLFAACFWLGAVGTKKLGLARRFQRYVELLRDRTYCTVAELASGTGRSENFVLKDLRKMIRKGFFPEGHLDRKGTCLMTDYETYQQYLLTEQAYDRRIEEKKKESGMPADKQNQKDIFSENDQKRDNASGHEKNGSGIDAEPESSLNHECRELIREGNRYITHIRECNDRIPGEEISAKLDRLELVVTRIFREVDRRPELAPELRKMMSYYLPTTQKLLDAYCQLDEQPVRGQNIENTKKEIENALDTINEAFENLLDSFFENTAWDISSDISVLHTMFAQEGLTGQDFAEYSSKKQ